MLTERQKKWINNLSDEDKIEILPFDETSIEKFNEIKDNIGNSLGKEIKVEHHGSTSLGIAGQNEIDIFIPLPPNEFYLKTLVAELSELFGSPKSVHKTRIRFQIFKDSKKIDIFLIDENSKGWLDGLKFEEYLKTHNDALKEYEDLKYACIGLSIREFYKKKLEYINKILSY